MQTFEDGGLRDQQTARYYAERAAYYERVYLKPERQKDLRQMEALLPGYFVGRHVLELACGTGWWTPHGARDCGSWLATDLNDETMQIARRKAIRAGKVQFQVADAYTLAELGTTQFNAAFAGCWWSHVPRSRLHGWLDTLHGHLSSGARVVMLDNSFVQTSNLPISRRDADGNTYQVRTLDDGSTYEVIKNFPTAEEAGSALGPRAVNVRWMPYEHYWVLAYELT